MAQPKTARVIQVCPVAPPQGTTISTTPIPTSLPLTFFDILWLRFPPVQRLFFYEFPYPTASFFDSVLPKLKQSLSLTLQHFLPLAGNLTWPYDSPKPIINFVSGDAVSLTIAESDADFHHLSDNNLCEALESRPLVPQLTVSHEQASVMALQLTLFPNSGFCIGITTHHAALDGKSSTLFMKSWAYVCSKLSEESSSCSSLPENLVPFYDRSVIKDRKGLEAIYVNGWLNHNGPNNRSLMVWESENTTQAESIRGTFELSSSHLQKLKHFAQSKLNKKVRLSTFSITCAYVVACFVKAEQTRAKRVAFCFAVDCRSRLDPSNLVPPTYVGNCIGGQIVLLETNILLGNDGIIHALEGISAALNRLDDGDGVLSGAESWISIMLDFKEDRLLSVAGSPRFEVYSTDFGWGRPKKVEITSIDETGAFSLAESRNSNGGIEIGLVLNKHAMEAFADNFVKGLEVESF